MEGYFYTDKDANSSEVILCLIGMINRISVETDKQKLVHKRIFEPLENKLPEKQKRLNIIGIFKLPTIA